MAAFTANYGLHQWEPGDNFLRTDFNEDFFKIDGAIRRAEDRAGRALDALVPMGANVYGLLLQAYYEGRHTGYRKALVFDGFLDGAGISALTAGLVRYPPERALLLDAQGLTTAAVNFGSGGSFTLRRDSSAGNAWTATGNGTLTAVESYFGGTSANTWTVIVSCGGEELGHVTRSVTGSAEPAAFTGFSIPVTAGRTYQIALHNDGPIYDPLVRSANADLGPGFRMTFTPSRATAGTMTGVSQPLEGAFQGARAWVRHTSGTISLSLRGGDGAARSMTRTGTGSALTPEGAPCTESAFTLEQRLSGPLQVSLGLSTSAGQSVRVYDYGVMLL